MTRMMTRTTAAIQIMCLIFTPGPAVGREREESEQDVKVTTILLTFHIVVYFSLFLRFLFPLLYFSTFLPFLPFLLFLFLFPYSFSFSAFPFLLVTIILFTCHIVVFLFLLFLFLLLYFPPFLAFPFLLVTIIQQFTPSLPSLPFSAARFLLLFCPTSSFFFSSFLSRERHGGKIGRYRQDGKLTGQG